MQHFGLPSLLRRLLITFSPASRRPHTRRWLNDWLSVVVNYASHGAAAKASLLTGPRGEVVAHGPSSSLLHAVLEMHGKATLRPDVRQLVCHVLRSASLEASCRAPLLQA